MKILVTGGTGKVGTEVVQALLRRGASVWVLTRNKEAKLPDGAVVAIGDLVSSEMLSGPDAAATWSKLLGKEITYAGHGDLDGFEAQLRKTGSPSWLAYDLRVMFQGYVERGCSNTEYQTARFAALLGHQPRMYSGFAEELAKEWAAA